MNDQQRIATLLFRQLQETLTDEEQAELKSYLSASPATQQLSDSLQNEQLLKGKLALFIAMKKKAGQDAVTIPYTPPAAVPHIPFVRRWRWAAAAALILAVGMATAIVMYFNQRTNTSGTGIAQTVASDILPGTNRAVLTVDDKKIDLSSDKTGIAVGEKISYTDGEQLSYTGRTMQLATPNGGQYQLILPDGTRAWLNAASSIRFPSVFAVGKREITVTGEVYLEVAMDKTKPFFVDVNGQSTIEVLGTSFNVHSYANEKNITTTLVDGSVKVLNSASEQVILKPGYQAVVTRSHQQQPPLLQPKNRSAILIQSADIARALAWKNGIFDFTGADFTSVMKQLERWYDIKVQYKGAVPAITFDGKMYRNVRLSGVLDMLNTMDVTFRMEGKTLIIL